MKALSLMEPWAALIAAGVKSIETRSWRTAYRGPLYIHASRAKVDQKDPHIQRLLSLLPEGSLHPGFVVCRCVLKDCLPMDESYIDAHLLDLAADSSVNEQMQQEMDERLRAGDIWYFASLSAANWI